MRKVLLLLSLWITLGLCAQETIKIGVVIPLSGPAAAVGEDARDGIKLRLMQLEKEKTRFSYQLIYEDSQNLPRLAAEAFKKLSEIDKVDMVISFGSGPGSTISALAKNKSILHIGGGYSTAIAEGPLNFNSGPLPELSAKKTIEYLKALKIQRVAFITLQHAGTKAVEDEFLKNIPNTSISIVNQQRFNPGEKDFRVAILRIREANPQIVFIEAFDPEASIILKQMEEIGYHPPISAIGAWGLVTHAAFYGIPYSDPQTNPAYNQDFKKAYQRIPQPLSAFTVDAFSLLISATEKTHSKTKPSPENVAKELESTRDFQGYSGQLNPTAEGWFSGPADMVIKTPNGAETVGLTKAIEIFHQRWPSSVAK